MAARVDKMQRRAGDGDEEVVVVKTPRRKRVVFSAVVHGREVVREEAEEMGDEDEIGEEEEGREAWMEGRSAMDEKNVEGWLKFSGTI